MLGARNQNIIFQADLKADKKLGGIKWGIDLFLKKIVTKSKYALL